MLETHELHQKQGGLMGGILGVRGRARGVSGLTVGAEVCDGRWQGSVLAGGKLVGYWCGDSYGS